MPAHRAPSRFSRAALGGEGHALGVDIGGTTIKAVVVGPDGGAVLRRRQPTEAAKGPAEALEGALRFMGRLLAEVSGTGAHVCSIGVVVPGMVDEAQGVVRRAVNLGWEDLALGRLVSERFGCPAYLGHDVRAGGLAEHRLGAARGVEDFLFVPVGTGIGSAVFLGGQARQGSHADAGEVGHVVVEAGGPACRCGGRGCLEVLASAPAIARRYRERVGEVPAGTGEVEAGAAEVVARAAQGDGEAREVWLSALSYLGLVVASVQGALDLELIVIGGGLARAGASLLDPLRAELSGRLPAAKDHRRPRLVLAVLGDDAGCFGAALLARSLGH